MPRMMPATHKPSPDTVIELLCQQGCQSVRHAISRIEQGETPCGTEGLSPAECHAVLAELRAIMAVYDH
ncbi:MAG: hypothetical protein LPJ91_03285 [Pseudazoarcus pumilus]|nr:hypothetical protein [Pseudazoarcus pumilus]